MNRIIMQGKTIMAVLAMMSLTMVLTDCKEKESSVDSSEAWYEELYRPQFHFSPKTGWMNDPNGMVYHEGEYHLFYQYYPDSTIWGPMHWGHAIATDLIHWEHLPIGIYPDSLGWIFSGSAVYDQNNTSGFAQNGKNPLIAIFTHHYSPGEQIGSDTFQYQSIAYSLDNGRSWTAYEDNPVLKNPGIRDFRDPKVFWHEESEKWIMTLAALNKVIFYGSPNLKSWEYLSEFGTGIGSHDGVWECPDLFPLKDEEGNEHWVLLLNMNPGNPNGGSGTQYFIGDFDGKSFMVSSKFEELLQPLPEFVPTGEIFEDFESGMENWSEDTEVFSTTARNDAKGRMVSSIILNNAEIGSITSKEFTITSKAINFLIGGGNHRGKTLIGLEVDGRLVRESEGNNQDEMTWKGWDVSPYQGQKARIKIIDNYQGDWGFIEVDQITFADEVAHGQISGSVWLDAGADNYAGVTWTNIPESDGRRIFLGWMSNWAYAQVTPTVNWRSAMTIPLELKIKNVDGIPRLMGHPVEEVLKLRDGDKVDVQSNRKTPLPDAGLADIFLQFEGNTDFEIEIGNEMDEHITFSYMAENKEFSFDRVQSGRTDFSPDFKRKHSATRISSDEIIELRLLLDHSSAEIFIDGGLNIFSEVFFPTKQYNVISMNGSGQLNGYMYPLKGIWK